MLSMKSGTVTQLGLFNTDEELLKSTLSKMAVYSKWLNGGGVYIHTNNIYCVLVIKPLLEAGVTTKTPELRKLLSLLIEYSKDGELFRDDIVFIVKGDVVLVGWELKLVTPVMVAPRANMFSGASPSYFVDVFEQFVKDCDAAGLVYKKELYNGNKHSVIFPVWPDE